MKLWTGIVTPRVTDAAAFYIELFGFQEVYRGDNDWFVLLQKNGAELGFVQPDRPEQAAAFRTAYSGDGLWLVLDVEDVQAVWASSASPWKWRCARSPGATITSWCATPPAVHWISCSDPRQAHERAHGCYPARP